MLEQIALGMLAPIAAAAGAVAAFGLAVLMDKAITLFEGSK